MLESGPSAARGVSSNVHPYRDPRPQADFVTLSISTNRQGGSQGLAPAADPAFTASGSGGGRWGRGLPISPVVSSFHKDKKALLEEGG
jgi:hypothetical protein